MRIEKQEIYESATKIRNPQSLYGLTETQMRGDTI
jgi:hypothetical protein